MLKDISRINDLVETIGFKINKLLIDNIASKSRLEVLEFRKGNISIKLEATHFGSRYDFLISEEVEYSYNRNDIEKHLETRRDPGFRYTGSRLVGTDTKIDYGYIKYDSFTLNLSSSQTEPDFETIIEIIKKTFKGELRDIKINQLMS